MSLVRGPCCTTHVATHSLGLSESFMSLPPSKGLVAPVALQVPRVSEVKLPIKRCCATTELCSYDTLKKDRRDRVATVSASYKIENPPSPENSRKTEQNIARNWIIQFLAYLLLFSGYVFCFVFCSFVRGLLGTDPQNPTLESASPSPSQGSIWHRNRVKSMSNRCRINVKSMSNRCHINP